MLLLAAEGVTILSIRPLLSAHVFIGMLLIPPVALKLGSTGWRFVSYYRGREAYVVRGPPRIALRVLAAPLVLATVVLFGTGVAFLAVGHGGGLLLTAHAASFAVWGVLVGIHALAYLGYLWRYGLADWRRARIAPAGSRLRRFAVVAALLAGAVVGLATYSTQTAWLSHRHHRHRFEFRGD